MQERPIVSTMDINAHMNNLRKNSKYTEEMLKLAESDLQYGLLFHEVEMYLSKKFDYSQMKVYSKCLRNEYPEEVRDCITKETLTGEQMAVALEFYEKGVPLENIVEVMENDGQTALMMKKSFQNIVEKMQEVENAAKEPYAEKLFQKIKSVVEKIEAQEKQYDIFDEILKELQVSRLEIEKGHQFLEQLEEKDHMLEQQQNELNQARATIANLKKEKEQMERHILEITREAAKNHQHSIKETEREEVQEKEDEQKFFLQEGSSIKYRVAVVDKNGKVIAWMPTVQKEKQQKKSFLPSWFSKSVQKKKIDMVKLVAEKNLKPEQIVQVRNAIEKGLREDQIMTLINSQVPAEQMEEIIHIAVYENQQNENRM